MKDLESRLRSVDQLDATDLWSDIEHRHPRSPIDPSPTPARRALIAAVALVIATVAIGSAIAAFQRRDIPVAPLPALRGNGELYYRVGGGDGPSWWESVQPDGSAEHTVFPADDRLHVDRVAWSPDGTRIAFRKALVGSYGIYTANADGSDVRRLTDGPNDSWPSWSPDGTRIVFSSTRGDPSIAACTPGDDIECPTDLYVMNADGSNIIRASSDPEPEFDPVWSPDGTTIAFTRAGVGSDCCLSAIWSLEVGGSGSRPIAAVPDGSNFSPSWSPDGTQLSYLSIRGEQWWVYASDADGTNERVVAGAALADDPGSLQIVEDATWSPDGSWIAFTGTPCPCDASSQSAIYLVRPDGADLHQIASPDSGASDIAWRPLATSTPSASEPWAAVPDGWTELPAPPLAIRGGTMVWTGSELILWGGTNDYESSALAKAFAYDPVSGRWSELPAPPFGTYGATGFWTGSEALFWGGQDPSTDHQDGVAFDPASGSWRRIAAAPIDPGWGGAGVWTGQQLIVFGGGIQVGDPRNVQAAAYDPATDSWERLPDAPIGLNRLSGTWTGTEAVFFGSLQNGNNHSETPVAVGVAYDPSTGSWRSIAPSPLNPQATSIVTATDGSLFAWDYLTQGSFYDPGSDSWGELQKLPFRTAECGPQSVVLGDTIFAWYCGSAAAYDMTTAKWQRVDGGMLAQTVEGNGTTYPLFQSTTLVSAGDVIAFAGEGITVDEDGVPCFGCAGSPSAFWVFRPD